MNRRHALRFENGERRGETLPLEGAGRDGVLTVGRRPGNTIQIADPSVSGRHAELAVDAGGVTVRDLGSTNGTRVGDERVSAQQLAHGDVLHFGNVRVTFLDSLVHDDSAPPPPAATPTGTTDEPTLELAATRVAASGAGDDVHRVSADALARSRGRFSAGTWALLVLIAGGGAGAFFWLRGEGGGAARAAPRPVAPVAGNLLAEGFSFEDAAPDGRVFEERWTAADAAPASFELDSSARRTGEQGLSASLAGGEWAEHRSEAVRAPRGGTLELLAWARTDAVEVTAGVRFEHSGGASGSGTVRPVTVWTAAVAADDFEPLEASVPVPPGYDTARAVLRARSTLPAPTDAEADSGSGPQGWAEFDDVSLVAGAGGSDPVKIGEYELTQMGPAVCNLFKIDRVLISSLAVEQAGARVALSREQRDSGLVLHPSGAGVLTLFAEPELVAGGVATLGAPGGESGAGAGYRSHQVEFEREGVRSILLGAGRDMVRVGLSAPATVSGRPGGAGFHLEVPLAAGAELELQLVFNAERNEAQQLARNAREAERRGAPGEAVVLWERVLNEFPYEASLLEEAGQARGRLLSAGLVELRALGQRVERARFFRLVDDYRACRADTQALGERFAGTEVQDGARALAESIDGRLGVLERDLDRHERARLEAIARSLQESQSPLLAARVQDYLAARYGDLGPERPDPDAPDPDAIGAGPDDQEAR